MHGGKAMVEIFGGPGVTTSSPPREPSGLRCGRRSLSPAAGDHRPSYINCRHEAAAVAMASGYTKITGKPQAVLLHATAGPLNAAMFCARRIRSGCRW